MIRKFEPSDYPVILSWYLARGLEAPKLDALPERGYITDNVAAGFLYKTDSTVCIIEGLIANPESDKDERNKALDNIVDELINDAVVFGFTRIFGFSASPVVVERALGHGFNKGANFTLIEKEL